METLKNALEKNPNLKLLGKKKIQKITGVSSKIIEEYFKNDEIRQIYARPKKVKSYKINGPPNSYQIDIMILNQYRQSNDIYQVLLIIDILSRKLFAYPLKDGKMKTILHQYKKFVKKNKVVSVEGDDFFNNKEFKDYNKEHSIEVYSDIAKDDHITNHGNKLGIIDRVTRTIKDYIEKYLLTHNTTNWVDALPQLIKLYNDSPHKGINDKTPNEAFEDEDFQIKKYVKNQKYNNDIQASLPFKVGDKVRVLLGKETFGKEKAPFSKEIYTILEINGRRFILEDENGKLAKRRYRPSELLITNKTTNRLGSKLDEEKKIHKKINKTSRGLKVNYDDAKVLIEKKHLPKEARIKKKVHKLNL